MKKKILALFFLRVAKLFLGVITLSVSAKYFGVNIERDVWLLAFNFITLLDLALWGPINETFRAKFIFIRDEQGLQIAMERTRSLLIFTFFVCFLFVLLIVVFRFQLAGYLAPSYHDLQLNKLAEMLLIISPIFLINQMIQIGISVLNAFNVFFIPEVASFITSIISILLIIFLAPVIGIGSLAVSYYIGVLLLLLLVLLQLKKQRIDVGIRLRDLQSLNFSGFLIYAAPFFLPYFLGQFSGIVEKTLSSIMGTGMVSIIDYSRKFTDIIVSVTSSVLTSMLVPTLATLFLRGDRDKCQAEFMSVFQMGILFITFVTAFFVVGADDLVAFLYDKGNISYSGLAQIAKLSVLYIAGCLPVFIYLMLGVTLLASNRSKTYASVGMLAQVVILVVNLLLYKRLGPVIFPISSIFSHFLAAIVMYQYLPFRGTTLLIKCSKYFIIVVASVVGTYLFDRLINFNGATLFNIIVRLTEVSFVFSLCLFIFKAQEIQLIVSYIRRLKRRKGD